MISLNLVYTSIAVGIAYSDFLCPHRPMIMYPGEERDVSLRLQNSHDVEETVRVKVVSDEANIASFSEGDYTVGSKVYDEEIKVKIEIRDDAVLGEKHNIVLSLFNIPSGNVGGISMTTKMDVNICIQVGEKYVPPAVLSPEEPVNTTLWIVIGAIVFVIIIAGIIYLIKRKKK